MVDQILLVTQRPDHVARIGATVVIDGDPFIVRAVKPKPESGVFLDFGGVVESNEVEATVERFDGYPVAFILLVIAALGAFGAIRVSGDGFALGGLAFWALSGAL